MNFRTNGSKVIVYVFVATKTYTITVHRLHKMSKTFFNVIFVLLNDLETSNSAVY